MDNLISLQQAIDMTTLYRAQKDKILSEVYKGKNILSISETFNAAAFQAILDHPDCVSVRIYFGMNDDSILRNIIVGVNSDNEDLLPEDANVSTLATSENSNGNPPIAEEGIICPPLCPPPSKSNP